MRRRNFWIHIIIHALLRLSRFFGFQSIIDKLTGYQIQ